MKINVNIESIGNRAKVVFAGNNNNIQTNMFANLKWIVQDGQSEDDTFFYCEKSRLRRAIKTYINVFGECPFKFTNVSHRIYNGTNLSLLSPYKQGEYQDTIENVWLGHKSQAEKYFDKVA